MFVLLVSYVRWQIPSAVYNKTLEVCVKVIISLFSKENKENIDNIL